ncbi:MAG: Bpu10I family restriction endonuclease [Brachymonas sp.]|nr:Bpu10I family restriction endonuclease [Brachymonas sp.]
MYVHGDNLEQKENHPSKYQDKESKRYLREIRKRYDAWRQDNIRLKGPIQISSESDIALCQMRTKLLNDYKDFLDQQHFAEKFDSRSNLHSSVLEEFMYYLFQDLVASISTDALIGKSHTFKDLFIRANSFRNMLDAPQIKIEKKDHDFAIGTRLEAQFQTKSSTEAQKENWDIPAIAIECKTYLDKTMLQDASTAAEQLKHRNPEAMYVVVTEWLKLTESVNLRKFKIDQIYVLRKQKNTDREYRYAATYQKNPIYSDVVYQLFDDVRKFLTEPWEGAISHGLSKGVLL